MTESIIPLNITDIYLSGITIKIKVMMPPIKKKSRTFFADVDIFEPVNVLYSKINRKDIILISPSLALTI